MLQDFKKFLMRGNLIDLAVAVVIGAAFGAVVASFVADIVTPLIAAVGGQPDFSTLAINVGESQITYGNFINVLFYFVIVAGVMFGILKTVEKLEARRASGEDDAPEPAPSKEEQLLTDIRDLLARQTA